MHIRIGLVASMTLVAACKGKSTPLPKLAEQAPVMADAARLAGAEARVPPVLVTIATDGALAVADAPQTPDAWTVLSTRAPRTKGQPIDLASIGSLVKEATALGSKIEPMLADRKRAPDVDLTAAPSAAGLDDDPPPPEPEEELEDEDDESGGIGTAMALDEGKMGKKDSDRAAGSYTLKRADHEQLARDQAVAAARSAGIIANLDHGRVRGGFGGAGTAPDPEMPTRALQVVGRAVSERDRDPRALIVAAPNAKATVLVDVIAAIGPSFIAVSHQSTLRALRVGFELDRVGFDSTEGGDRWIEVRIGADALTIEAVPAPPLTVPWAQGPLDAGALTKAYAAARIELGDQQRLDVDILVGPDTDVQRAVDAIAALDAAGALAISLGRAPALDSPEAAKRGKRIVRATLGQPQSVGDLDRAIIRRFMLEKKPQIKACYEQALLTSPELEGTVSTQFFIAPNGTVAAASAAGVSPEVADCVATIIKAIEFPKPKGGGGVQVNYPFTFQQ